MTMRKISEELDMNTKGHLWKRDFNVGGVDIFAYETGYHNGPICVLCGYSFCRHCNNNVPTIPCSGVQTAGLMPR